MTSNRSDTTRSVFFIVGTPLDESEPLSSRAISAIKQSYVIVGESKKVSFRYLKQAGELSQKEIFFLDGERRDEMERMRNEIERAAQLGFNVVLFSDTGMPILFDPGAQLLQFCRRLHFKISSIPSATSWGTAMALSGFDAPFLVQGFLPREIPLRIQLLRDLLSETAHLVFMDTPYRFTLLLDQVTNVFGAGREAFLAWEISKTEESLLWGSLRHIQNHAEERGMKKGEFVLIVHGASGRS